MLPIPHEISLGGVYLSPLVVAAALAFGLTILTVRLFDRYRLAKHFFYPPLVGLSLMVIYTVLISTFVIAS